MENLEHYTSEMKETARQATKQKGLIGGGTMAWAMMLIGVIVTGTMTYSLTYKGMQSSALWREWVAIAAFLPVTLLEGSALALVYGRHYWFRSSQQRGLADVAGWLIWIVLAATSITHFAAGASHDQTVESVLSFYASYILPLSIVAIPMLWKRLYDSAPESAMRVAVLATEAQLRSDLVEIAREQNALMVASYREGLRTPEVEQARRRLFEKASMKHAQEITGFILDTPQASAQSPAQGNRVWMAGQVVDPGERRPN